MDKEAQIDLSAYQIEVAAMLAAVKDLGKDWRVFAQYENPYAITRAFEESFPDLELGPLPGKYEEYIIRIGHGQTEGIEDVIEYVRGAYKTAQYIQSTSHALELLRHSDAYTRVAAVCYLGAHGSIDEFRRILPLLEDQSEMVRRAAQDWLLQRFDEIRQLDLNFEEKRFLHRWDKGWMMKGKKAQQMENSWANVDMDAYTAMVDEIAADVQKSFPEVERSNIWDKVYDQLAKIYRNNYDDEYKKTVTGANVYEQLVAEGYIPREPEGSRYGQRNISLERAKQSREYIDSLAGEQKNFALALFRHQVFGDELNAEKYEVSQDRQAVIKRNITRLLNKPERYAEDSMDQEAQTSFECECLNCGNRIASSQHCADVTCPKCGGRMRRTDRPGIGRHAVEKDAQVSPLSEAVIEDNNESIMKQVTEHGVENEVASGSLGPKEEDVRTMYSPSHMAERLIRMVEKQDYPDMQTAFNAVTSKEARQFGVVTDEAKKDLAAFLTKLGHEVKAIKEVKAQEVKLPTTAQSMDAKLTSILERVTLILDLLTKRA